MVRSNWQRCLLVALIPLVSACSSHLRTEPLRVTPTAVTAAPSAVAPAPAGPPAAVQPPRDPVLVLIDASTQHFTNGQRELEQGHFEAAKQQFNRAVDGLLESPYGGRTEPRIREHFDRLVD